MSANISATGRYNFRQLFSMVRGNARVLVITEGISNLTFQWYGTYLSLYMLALGLDEVSIGWLASVYLLTQFISTLMGGHFADRFGRKRILVVGDILCWGIPLFLYAIAQNPWYLLIGRLINGFIFVVVPSFDCLFVEDVPEENRQAVFGLLQFLMAAGSLLAPVSGYLVARLGMLLAGRIIMFATMAMAIGIAVIRQFTLVETSAGREKISSTQSVNITALIKSYLQALKVMAVDRQVGILMVIRALSSFSTVIWMTYAMIYLTDPQAGGLPQGLIAVLPIASAVVTLGTVLFAANRFASRHVFNNLITGQVLWLASAAIFLLSPPRMVWAAVLWMLISALSMVLVNPAMMSYWANIVDDRQRAIIYSTATALITAATLPAGPLAGMLYTLSPRLPFVLTFGLQIVILGLVVWLFLQRRSPVELHD